MGERYGYKVIRPEMFITFERIPVPLWRRLLQWPGYLLWGFLTIIAPALPVLGALAGVAVTRAIFGVN